MLITGTAGVLPGNPAWGVEVSTNGNTWQPAVGPAAGQTSWSFAWTPAVPGSVTIRSRAFDDSGNLGTPGPGVTVSVAASQQLTIWPSNAVPSIVDQGPDNPVALGVKFYSEVGGTIKGIRFYKSSANTGTHVGNLWSSTGTLLATTTFTSETGIRMAAGKLYDAGDDQLQHDLRGLVPHQHRTLQLQSQLFLH